MIKRQLQEKVGDRLFDGKAIVLMGARQVGKTTLVKRMLETRKTEVQFFDGDDPTVRRMLDEPNTEQIRQLISERLKQLRYAKQNTRMHFWRTKQQQEVDYVEVSGSDITGYEFKWNPKRDIRFPKTFTKNYSQNVYGIHRDNFRDFVILEHNS